jgi:hypothetical protein
VILIPIIISLAALPACIDDYNPKIEAIETNKYVVSGHLSSDQEYHIISVSLASRIDDPELIPLNDCVVKIADDQGNIFTGHEFEGGKYQVLVPAQYLLTGVSFMLDITTPAGAKLVSEYEKLMECPDIDSVYYIREDKPTNDPEVFIKGIQFYIDLDAPEFENTYYKFDVIETWEYHTEYPLEWWYDGTLHHVDPPDYSTNICWSTAKISDIYILNTEGLEYNRYSKFPLHFVDNTTRRLIDLYSILVKQQAISLETYAFWEQLRMNNIEQGGLYESQPLPVKGNLSNLTKPEQSVLGYFQVTSVRTKRLFVKDVPDLELIHPASCGIYTLMFGLRQFSPADYPVYLLESNGAFMELTKECIFCTILGGTTVRPDFWPG